MDNDTVKLAAIQMVSTLQIEENFATVRYLIGQAAQQGAELVLLPEYWPIMGMHETDKIAHAEQPGTGPIQQFMSSLAREHGIWLIGGTLPMMAPEEGKILNTTSKRWAPFVRAIPEGRSKRGEIAWRIEPAILASPAGI